MGIVSVSYAFTTKDGREPIHNIKLFTPAGFARAVFNANAKDVGMNHRRRKWTQYQ